MTTEAKRIQLFIDSDPRLAAAAGGALRFLAENAGMPEELCKEFQEATVQACLKAFQTGGSHKVDLWIYGDRLEVVVDPDAGSAAIRLSRSVVSQH